MRCCQRCLIIFSRDWELLDVKLNEKGYIEHLKDTMIIELAGETQLSYYKN